MAGTEEPFAKFPKFKALKEKVKNLPKISAWIVNRPKTEY